MVVPIVVRAVRPALADVAAALADEEIAAVYSSDLQRAAFPAADDIRRGDLLFWPNSDRTRAEVLAQAAFVPIENGFRAEYDYCNLMFVVAGAVIEAASGQSWEAFVQSRILDRVGMAETVPLARLADPAKSALPHGRIGPPLRYQGEMQPIGESIVEVWNWDSAAAAGGLCATPTDWAKWIAVRLNEGLLPDGSRLAAVRAGLEALDATLEVGALGVGPGRELTGRAAPLDRVEARAQLLDLLLHLLAGQGAAGDELDHLQGAPHQDGDDGDPSEPGESSHHDGSRQPMLVPAELSSWHACTTRAAMASSALAPHTRGSYIFLSPTSPSTFSTPA